MANFVESFGYSNAFVFDTEGSLLFQLKPNLEVGSNLLTGPLKESELAEVFDRVRTLLQTEVSDYQMYPGRSEPAAFIASPCLQCRRAGRRVHGPRTEQRTGLSCFQGL